MPRLAPHDRLLLAPSDEGPALEPALAAPDGRIQIDNKLGRGSTFSFSIKLGRAPQPERRGPGLEVDVTGKARPCSTRPSPSPASTPES